MHTYGAQALPGHRFLLFFSFSFLFLLWLLSLSVACCSLDVRAAYTAVYDRYSSQSATFLFFFARSADNLLLRMVSPSLGDVSVSAPVRSFLSHFPASSCFDWA